MLALSLLLPPLLSRSFSPLFSLALGSVSSPIQLTLRQRRPCRTAVRRELFNRGEIRKKCEPEKIVALKIDTDEATTTTRGKRRRKGKGIFFSSAAFSQRAPLSGLDCDRRRGSESDDPLPRPDVPQNASQEVAAEKMRASSFFLFCSLAIKKSRQARWASLFAHFRSALGKSAVAGPKSISRYRFSTKRQGRRRRRSRGKVGEKVRCERWLHGSPKKL